MPGSNVAGARIGSEWGPGHRKQVGKQGGGHGGGAGWECWTCHRINYGLRSCTSIHNGKPCGRHAPDRFFRAVDLATRPGGGGNKAQGGAGAGSTGDGKARSEAALIAKLEKQN